MGVKIICTMGLVGILMPIIALFAGAAWAQDLELVSRQGAADGGAQGNGFSGDPSISANGRFVAFTSGATNLIPGGGPDTNGANADVFVFDRTAGVLELVSRQASADGGAQGNSDSFGPSISADGRFIAFTSRATNLIPGGGPDANGDNHDIYVFDRTTGDLELVSRQDAADGGVQGNSYSVEPSISADGRFVAFQSHAGNLIPGGGPDTNGALRDIFVFDRATGELKLVSRQNAADGGAQGNGDSWGPSISAGGRFVAFTSQATNLIPGGVADANGSRTDVFVFDWITGALELVSRQDAAHGGAQGNQASTFPSISADGRFVAFTSQATNLIPGGGPDANGYTADIFVFDRTTGRLELVSRHDAADGGVQGNSPSIVPSISASGRFIAFYSNATNLIPGGGPDAKGSQPDVFVYDRSTGGFELVSRQDAAHGGAQEYSGSNYPSISADGRFVAFQSWATNLIPGGGPDANGVKFNVFIRRLKAAN